MDRSSKRRQARSAPVLTPYVVVWLAGAVLSFGYLSALLVAPQWLEEWTPALVGGDPIGNRGERAPAKLTMEIEALRAVVTRLQSEIEDLRMDAVQRSERESALNEQFAVLRKQVASEKVEETADGEVDDTVEANDESVVPDVINTEQQTARKPAVSEQPTQPQPKEVATGSVSEEKTAKPVEKKAETKVAKASSGTTAARAVRPSPAGVMISTADSVHGLRIAWGLLSERYVADLGQLHPRYTVATRDGKSQYDLIAGPIASKGAAQQVCINLKERGLNCAVATFTGNAL